MSESARREPPLPIVTIAALSGADGDVVGARVAARLAVPFLDRAIPAGAAARAGLPETSVDEVDETPHRPWQQLLDRLGRASPPTAASAQVEQLDLDERRLRAEIEDVIADATRSGGVVLGRGGAVLLGSLPWALHVHLGGDRNARIARVMALEGVDRETAAQHLQTNDEARRAYVRTTYGVDGDDPSLYHMTLDAVELGVDLCVELIVASAEARARRVIRTEA